MSKSHSKSRPPAGAAEQQFYSTSEFATILGVSVSMLRRMVKAGRIPAYRLCGRNLFFKQADVDRLSREARVDHRGKEKNSHEG